MMMRAVLLLTLEKSLPSHDVECKSRERHSNLVPRVSLARFLRRLCAVDANLNLLCQSLTIVLVKRPSHLSQRPPRLSSILYHIHPRVRAVSLHQDRGLCISRRLLLRDGAETPVGEDIRRNDAQRGSAVVELDARFDEARGVGVVAVWKGEHEAALVVERLPGRGDGDLDALEVCGGDGRVEVRRREVVLGDGWAPDVGVGRDLDGDGAADWGDGLDAGIVEPVPFQACGWGGSVDGAGGEKPACDGGCEEHL